MLQTSVEKTIGSILAIGAPFITLFVLLRTVTDPVNVTKFLALGVMATSLAVLVTLRGLRTLWKVSRAELVAASFFVIFSTLTLFTSSAPITQSLYGVYGRNTGYLTYLFLTFVFLAALLLRDKKNHSKVLYGLIFAGLINVLYCGWAWLVGDFLPWSNPYGTILGTFGNPNFIGSFLGIFVSVFFAYLLQEKTAIWIRLIGAAVIILAILEILHSNAVQGVVVTAGGTSIVVFYKLRSKFNRNLIPSLYVGLVAIAGAFAVGGALQKGPLTDLIYKTSVSLRGEYWQAGINMANSNPLTGVGMDGYGDWFRRARDAQALILPGPNVVTNAAHNVPIDILAYGGWPLFLSYLGIILLALVALIKVTIRNKKYDFVFVGTSVGWACYQVQSIISINQIGLAVWGWLLSGALISYEFVTRNDENKKTSQPKREAVFSAQLVAGLGAILGLLIAIPPFNADSKWATSTSSGDLEAVKKALTSTYMTPTNSSRLINSVQLFENNKLYDLALEYAKQAVTNNPDYFDGWRVLYAVTNSTPADKQAAKENMIRLDPLNNEWKNLP
jgi:O-antigen ligase